MGILEIVEITFLGTCIAIGTLNCIYYCCPPLQPYMNACVTAIEKFCCNTFYLKKCGEKINNCCKYLSKKLDKCCKTCFGYDVGRNIPDEEEAILDVNNVVIQQNQLSIQHEEIVIVGNDQLVIQEQIQ